MLPKKRSNILTKDVPSLPWKENPTEARRIYQRIYREAHRTNPETAILKHLGVKKKKR